MLSNPAPKAEHETRFGHNRRTLPVADDGTTVPRASVEGYVPYEAEVQEWKAKGWEDKRDQRAFDEAYRRRQE